MKTSRKIKKLAAGLMSAAILFSGSSLMSETGCPVLSEQITASAWSANDPHYKGASVTARTGRNQYLSPGDFLANGRFRAVMQGDGNFVIYDDQARVGNTTKSVAQWSTCTALEGGYSGYQFVVQEDGNIVIYATPKSNGGKRWVWATGTSGAKGYYTLKLESDGDLVLYNGSYANGSKRWSRKGDNRVQWHLDLRAQNEGYYAGYRLGNGSNTIGSHGCALASVTMIYNYYKGTAKNPDALNNQTYLDGASMNWTKANCQLDLRDWGNTWGSSVYSKIQNYLKNGPIVVFIDKCRYYTANNSGHFVVVYRCTKSSGTPTAADFRVLDPAYKNAGSHDMTLQQSMNLVGGSQITQIETWSMGGGRKMPAV